MVFFTMKRSLLGIFLTLTFTGLLGSGLWLFWHPADGKAVIIHLLLALCFLLVLLVHISNNLKPLRSYLRKHPVVLIFILSASMVVLSSGASLPEHLIRDYARLQQLLQTQPDHSLTVYEFAEPPNLSVELRAGQQFWFPQVAIWITDTAGHYMKTLFVTHSTAKGEFYGGRTKQNFKEFDQSMGNEMEIHRVDALPYWSYQHGVQAEDGLFAPTRNHPLPDGISGATADGSMLLHSKVDTDQPFKLHVELNVAFDDNRFYSAYDFPEDTLYHSGTGLMGQPSVVYTTTIYPHHQTKHYLLQYQGHTHPTQYGPLTSDTEKLTTALEILDLGLVSLRK